MRVKRTGPCLQAGAGEGTMSAPIDVLRPNRTSEATNLSKGFVTGSKQINSTFEVDAEWERIKASTHRMWPAECCRWAKPSGECWSSLLSRSTTCRQPSPRKWRRSCRTPESITDQPFQAMQVFQCAIFLHALSEELWRKMNRAERAAWG